VELGVVATTGRLSANFGCRTGGLAGAYSGDYLAYRHWCSARQHTLGVCQMNTIYTSQNIITLLLVGATLAFWGLERMVRSILRYIQESLTTSPPLTAAQLDKYSRVASADFLLKFVSVLVTATAALALALGIFKVYTDVANLVLPDRTLGLTVLMSYCGLFSAGGVVAEDIGQAVKKLFTN
jgi:hypothetical protein